MPPGLLPWRPLLATTAAGFLLFASALMTWAEPGVATKAPDASPSVPATIDFTRDVRPILVDRCFACHGPDDKTRKASLRLDERSGAVKKLRSGSVAIVPGKADQSELVAR